MGEPLKYHKLNCNITLLYGDLGSQKIQIIVIIKAIIIFVLLDPDDFKH